MKELIKNPLFYYILIPVAALCWPLLVSAYYLPSSKAKFQEEKKQFEQTEKLIERILALEPERLEYVKADKKTAEFDYANAIDTVRNLCNIPVENCKVSSSMVVQSRGGQKTQDASVVLDKIDIEKFAKFLSMMQMRWSNLQCTQLKLTKVEGAPDIWRIDMRFKYYF